MNIAVRPSLRNRKRKFSDNSCRGRVVSEITGSIIGRRTGKAEPLYGVAAVGEEAVRLECGVSHTFERTVAAEGDTLKEGPHLSLFALFVERLPDNFHILKEAAFEEIILSLFQRIVVVTEIGGFDFFEILRYVRIIVDGGDSPQLRAARDDGKEVCIVAKIGAA